MTSECIQPGATSAGLIYSTNDYLHIWNQNFDNLKMTDNFYHLIKKDNILAKISRKKLICIVIFFSFSIISDVSK